MNWTSFSTTAILKHKHWIRIWEVLMILAQVVQMFLLVFYYAKRISHLKNSSYHFLMFVILAANAFAAIMCVLSFGRALTLSEDSLDTRDNDAY